MSAALILNFSQVGELVVISDSDDLRAQFGNYYSFFTSSDTDAPFVVTVPYNDFNGLGK